MRRARPEQGFTLIELLVIGALIGIFATIAIPSFNTLVENNRTQTSHNELVELLKYARAQAVTERSTVSVCVAATSVAVTRGVCTAGNAPLRVLERSPLAAIAAQVDQVAFRPNGTATAASFTTCYDDKHAQGYFVGIEASGSIKSYPRGQAKGGAMTKCDLS